MGLLAPLLLGLGIAAAVPIVLHLLQRHQGPQVVFPALRYLRRAERDSARKVRLRQLLLLLMRVSAVLLLALAAARPFVRGAGADHAPTAVVMVLDNSASTGAVIGEQRVIDELRERALDALAQATPDDVFWLIRAATPWEPALRGDAATTAERVRATEPAAASADLLVAVGRARALLEAGAEGRASEIHLLTDLQASSLRDPPARVPDPPPLVVWSPADPVPPNAGVTAVEIGGGLPPRVAQRSEVVARIAGAGIDEVAVRLIVDDRVVAAATGAPGAEVALPFPARPAGEVAGWVEVDADALRADDRRAFVVRVEPAPAVALRDATPYVEQAIAVLEGAGRLRRAAAGITPEVVLAGGASGAEAARRGAGVVITPPADALELPAANQRLATAGIPWRFETVGARGEWRLEAPTDPGLHATLEGVQVRRLYALRAGPGVADTILASVQGGGAWAVKGRLPEGGAYVVLATPLTAEASSIPTSPALVPLLDRLAGEVAFAQLTPRDALPGEAIALPAAAREIERPDGTREPVQPGGVFIVPPATGLYRVHGEEDAAFAFAVNLEPAESELARADVAALRALLSGWQLHVTSSPARWRDAVYRERVGREIWRPLLLLALALLVAESVIAAVGRGRKRPATTTRQAPTAEVA